MLQCDRTEDDNKSAVGLRKRVVWYIFARKTQFESQGKSNFPAAVINTSDEYYVTASPGFHQETKQMDANGLESQKR